MDRACKQKFLGIRLELNSLKSFLLRRISEADAYSSDLASMGYKDVAVDIQDSLIPALQVLTNGNGNGLLQLIDTKLSKIIKDLK